MKKNDENSLNILEIFFKTYPTSINCLTNENIEVLLFKLLEYFSNFEINKSNEFENYIKITFSYLVKEKNYAFFVLLLDKVSDQLLSDNE